MKRLITLAALGLISSAAVAQEPYCNITTWLGGKCSLPRDDTRGRSNDRQRDRITSNTPDTPDKPTPTPGKTPDRTPPSNGGPGGRPTPNTPNTPGGRPTPTTPGRPTPTTPGTPTPTTPGTPTPTAPVDNSNPDGWNIPDFRDDGGNILGPDFDSGSFTPDPD